MNKLSTRNQMTHKLTAIGHHRALTKQQAHYTKSAISRFLTQNKCGQRFYKSISQYCSIEHFFLLSETF